MAGNPTGRKKPNSIEERREKAFIERVNKEASEGGRKFVTEIARAVLDESERFEKSGESLEATATKAAKAALIQSAISKAKAAVSRTATAHINAYDRCVGLVSAVEQAREEIGGRNIAEGRFYKVISDAAIANWLNDHGYKAAQGGAWSDKQVREVIFRGPERIITYWVLQCRTRMTAKALSADFSQPIDILNELERDYLDKIAEAIAISHRLNGHRSRNVEELLEEARHLAKMVSEEQRNVGSFNMLARERLWIAFAEEDGSTLLSLDKDQWP